MREFEDIPWKKRQEEHYPLLEFKRLPSEEYGLLTKRLEAILERRIEIISHVEHRKIKNSDSETGNFIHWDEVDVAFVSYLSACPLGNFHGTSFFKSHYSKSRHIHMPHETIKELPFIDPQGCPENQLKEKLRSLTHDKNSWSEWLRIEASTGRALIFPGRLFHAGPPAFGNDGTRITENFFAKFI